MGNMNSRFSIGRWYKIISPSLPSIAECPWLSGHREIFIRRVQILIQTGFLRSPMACECPSTGCCWLQLLRRLRPSPLKLMYVSLNRLKVSPSTSLSFQTPFLKSFVGTCHLEQNGQCFAFKIIAHVGVASSTNDWAHRLNLFAMLCPLLVVTSSRSTIVSYITLLPLPQALHLKKSSVEEWCGAA